jgi:hypothetical protein
VHRYLTQPAARNRILTILSKGLIVRGAVDTSKIVRGIELYLSDKSVHELCLHEIWELIDPLGAVRVWPHEVFWFATVAVCVYVTASRECFVLQCRYSGC